MRHTNFADAAAAGTVAHATAATNTAVVITVPALADEFHVLDWVSWSYSVAGAGRLTVVVGGTTLLDLDITAAGPGDWDPSSAIYKPNSPKNESMVITLGAVSGSIGKLTVRTR